MQCILASGVPGRLVHTRPCSKRIYVALVDAMEHADGLTLDGPTVAHHGKLLDQLDFAEVAAKVFRLVRIVAMREQDAVAAQPIGRLAPVSEAACVDVVT